MACDTIRLRVDGDGAIALRLDEDVGVAFAHDEYIKYLSSDMPDYDGSYSVTPRLAAQVLPTNDRVMRDDLTVEGIPSYRTTNPSGGYTVVIAQD